MPHGVPGSCSCCWACICAAACCDGWGLMEEQGVGDGGSWAISSTHVHRGVRGWEEMHGNTGPHTPMHGIRMRRLHAAHFQHRLDVFCDTHNQAFLICRSADAEHAAALMLSIATKVSDSPAHDVLRHGRMAMQLPAHVNASLRRTLLGAPGRLRTPHRLTLGASRTRPELSTPLGCPRGGRGP